MKMAQNYVFFNPPRLAALSSLFRDPVIAAAFRRGELGGGECFAIPPTKPKAPISAIALAVEVA